MNTQVRWFGGAVVSGNALSVTVSPVGAVTGGAYLDNNKIVVSANQDKVTLNCAPGYSITGYRFVNGGTSPRGLSVAINNGSLVMTVTDITQIPSISSSGVGGEKYSFTMSGPLGISFEVDPIIGNGTGGPGIISLN